MINNSNYENLKGTNLFPMVSVISPVYNGVEYIDDLINSINNQNYPKELLEIIIVDNKSTDNTKEIVKKYPVKLLEENEVRGSYAARNKGIKNANGDILAFIDSDCIASPQWIKEGIKAFAQDADLVGGKVEFYFSDKKTTAEMYDSITNMQIQYNIKERNVAKTANLFVKASLFDEIGLFPHHAISGGDVWWTAMATKAGYKLVYEPNAVVKHPARKLKELLKKQYRVGHGKIKAINAESRDSNKKSLLKSAVPKLSDIKKLIEDRGTSDMNKNIISIWMIAILCNMATGLGIITKSIKYSNK